MAFRQTGICVECGNERRIKARGLCGACYNRDWARDHKDEYQASNRRWKAANYDKVLEERQQRIRDPAKRRAHVAVQHAIEEGRLQRQSCRICGAELAEAHHADYSKPLEVDWLCPLCHVAEHVRLRDVARSAGQRTDGNRLGGVRVMNRDEG
jgi:hypothetical protein